MSKDIREMIDKIKNYKQVIKENIQPPSTNPSDWKKIQVKGPIVGMVDAWTNNGWRITSNRGLHFVITDPDGGSDPYITYTNLNAAIGSFNQNI